MKGKFTIKETKSGMFYFELSAQNGVVMATSQRYYSKSAIENAIMSVRKNAFDAVVVDSTKEDKMQHVNCLTRALWHWDKYGGIIMYDSYHATVINSSRFYSDGHKQTSPLDINTFGMIYFKSSHGNFLNEDEIKILERYFKENPLKP